MSRAVATTLLLAAALPGGCLPQGVLDGFGPPEPVQAPVEEPAPETDDLLFAATSLLAFDLLIPPDAWASLAQEPYDWVRGAFSWRGQTLPGVGIHIKGQWGSFRELDGKAAFRVGFDHFEPGQELLDHHSLTLNNMVQDSSKLHEAVGYTIYRALGVPAPRTSFCELRVNGELRGLYLVVEPPDRHFLARWVEDPHAGNLYEGAYGDDLWPDAIEDFEIDLAGGPDDRSDLLALAEAVQAPPGPEWLPRIEAVVDLPEVLSMMAADAMLSHWDGYAYTRNNYRIWIPTPPGRAMLLPWGIDQTFGAATDPFDFGAELAGRCMEDTECRRRYRLRLLQVADAWEGLRLGWRIDQAQALISDAVWADPLLEHDPADFEDMARELRDVVQERPGEIREQLFGP